MKEDEVEKLMDRYDIVNRKECRKYVMTGVDDLESLEYEEAKERVLDHSFIEGKKKDSSLKSKTSSSCIRNCGEEYVYDEDKGDDIVETINRNLSK